MELCFCVLALVCVSMAEEVRFFVIPDHPYETAVPDLESQAKFIDEQLSMPTEPAIAENLVLSEGK